MVLRSAFARHVAVGVGAAGVLLASATSLLAQDNDDMAERVERGNWAFGVTASTLGIGGEAALRVHPNIIVRLTGGYANAGSLVDAAKFSTHGAAYPTTSNDTRYGFSDLSLMSARAVLDWHPFRDGARFSAGMAYLSYSAKGEIKPEDAKTPVTIGDHSYTYAQYKDVTFEAKSGNSVLPYVGMGYDSAFFKDYGFSLSTDFGVLIGMKHDVTVNGANISAADREADAKVIKDKLWAYYPVVSLAAKYRF